jgi:thiosulfate/3-mercaptopyruvate sulfurtransferase
MTDPMPPIVSARWLAQHLASSAEASGTGREGGGGRVAVADVRWYLDGRSGREAFEAGHIADAVYIDLDRVLASPATAADGRHPLPPPEVFAAGLSEAGIGESDAVVAYDDLGGMAAGRLVWMLRILGLPAALLDGGLPAWDGPMTTGPATVSPVERPVRPWPADAIVDADGVAEAVAAGTIVVDARAPARFSGNEEPVDPRAGHIPGAVNLPFAANLDDGGRFKPPDQLAARFVKVGADGDSIVYCGSGVSACHNVLAMEHAGLDRPRLYVGSWSQWSSDPDRPAATGPS